MTCTLYFLIKGRAKSKKIAMAETGFHDNPIKAQCSRLPKISGLFGFVLIQYKFI